MASQIEKCYIGIDVSKNVFDIFILPFHKYMQFRNDLQGVKKFLRKVKTFSQALIVMESTGGYEKHLAQTLAKQKLAVAVVNPLRVRNFAKALGKLAKTDRIDAQTIALFAQKMQPTTRVTCNEQQQVLAALHARRSQLIEMVVMEKNRLDKASPALKKSIQRIIKTLEKELQTINNALQQAIQANIDLQHKQVLLQTINGVGEVVANGMIATLPELGQLSAKQITALAGLAPYNRDSGTFRGQRTISGGRDSVRRILYMAALVAIRYNQTIATFYQRLCLAGKKKKVAIIASSI